MPYKNVRIKQIIAHKSQTFPISLTLPSKQFAILPNFDILFLDGTFDTAFFLVVFFTIADAFVFAKVAMIFRLKFTNAKIQQFCKSQSKKENITPTPQLRVPKIKVAVVFKKS